MLDRFGECYLIPEGGSNTAGVEGAGEIVKVLDELEVSYRHLFLPVGTGGTLAGIASKLIAEKHVTGISALKGAFDLNETVERFAPGLSNWSIDHTAHLGGYAKCPDELKRFILDFELTTGVSLEPVYTAKMIYRMLTLMDDEISSDEVIAIHTGGLQGRRGFDF